jgi:simple sugar transport system substrate-binding protein
MEEEPMEEGPFTFGVILVGPKNDHGWSQAHAEGSDYVVENLLGSEAIVFESLNPADKPEATVENVTQEMISQGATLIFTTSDEFEEDTATVAEANPDVTFVNVSGDDAWAEGREFQAPSNLGNLMGRMEDMKAVAGCAAAMATETGKISYLGPLINFETRRLTASAYLGARYCYENYRGLNPDDLQFEVVWIGFWFNIPGVTLDPTEVVNQFIDGGSDVILSGIDTTEAIVVAGQRAEQGERVYAIPYDFVGACDESPDICLGVPFFNWGPGYLDIVQAVKDGAYEQDWVWSEPDWANLSDQSKTSVGWVPGPGLEANEEWMTAVDGFISSLASGDVMAWTGPINLQDGTEYVPAGEVASDQDIWYLPQLLEGMSGSSE